MLITDAALVDGRVRDVKIEGERIAAVERGLTPAADERVIPADGRLLFPGAVDVHVHFREPGFSHKETWKTGSRSAAAGGVTTVVDQPNTDPATTTGEGFDAKATLAEASLVDYGINGGVTPDWDPDALFDRPIFALGEVFLADSTGEMGIDADRFADAVERARDAGVTVTVHAENADLFDESGIESLEDGADEGASVPVGRSAPADAWSAYRTAEAEIDAIQRAVGVAADADATVHLAHTSTPEGVDAAVDAGVTCEVTPHHLFLSREDLPRLGTFGRMNPPLRSEERRAALFERLADGTVDVVATDHAPHTVEEKTRSLLEAPSGVPGVETMLPLLLESVRQEQLELERVRDLVAATPAKVFDIPRKGKIEPGRDADLVLVDLDRPREIEAGALHSKAGWTPFEGLQGVFPELTVVRGTVVYTRDPETGAETFGPAVGRNVRVGE
ncbi:Dihydroorotase or related cyclic amidohydrolase [Halalkaliarchaeum sp. AArc-CO]|uniref:dihydroorotase n=1 Tax=Halalkaliarchaeum sp. AArc-CO TaxID=2866381 RepID=UPI00217EC1E1|nr:dihydroorotase [Halalkaliarchaeum sp. AArc-CO]UWG51897.1 Dihydroorotase or related cyclic amidohydrolase [Halalkaliarchaeum sp. AArc-CO]